MDDIRKDLLANGAVYHRTTAALNAVRTKGGRRTLVAAILFGMAVGIWLGSDRSVAPFAAIGIVLVAVILVAGYAVRARGERQFVNDIVRASHTMAVARGRYLRQVLSDEQFRDLAQATKEAELKAVRQSPRLADFYTTAPTRQERRVLDRARKEPGYLQGVADWSWEDMSSGMSLNRVEQ